jgi:chromosome segregation ATPase
MGATLTLSVIEIILLFFGAIILGITIHFTVASRRSLKAGMNEKDEVNKFRDEWKSRYFNDFELKDKEISAVKEQLAEVKEQLTRAKEDLAEAEENVNIYTIEADEMRKENKKLLAEIEQLQKTTNTNTPVSFSHYPSTDKPDYLEQLRLAQSSLLEHNAKINQLLGNIDIFKETEEKQREILKSNAELSLQITDLRTKLGEKEKEISNIKQKEHLTKEMASMLDNAYSEFNVLQSKMQKLELQVSSSKMINMEYEDLKESYQKMNKEYEDQKSKLTVLASDNQHIQSQLMETEEKLRESNFQRQQLQKRVAYLEELNNDLQAVSDANKKLEGQLKRIGELESMLNVAAQERDHLIKKVEK